MIKGCVCKRVCTEDVGKKKGAYVVEDWPVGTWTRNGR